MPSTDDESTKSPNSASVLSFRAKGPALSQPTKRWLKEYRTEVSASTASLSSTLAAYPLDSIKTRMQAYHFSNVVQCVRHTYGQEGLHGFWRGALAPLFSITIVRTVSFSIYQKAKYFLDESIYRASGVSPLVHANSPGTMPSLATMACFGGAGACSGSVITLLSCPFELTKLSSQIAVLMERGVGKHNSFESPSIDPKPSNGSKLQPTAGTFKTARWIIKQRGALGLYSGFHLHLLRDTIGTAIYFTTYESSKQMLANARGASPTSPLAVVLAGGLCGIVSWACIYPIDSAKSIYQRNVLTAGASASSEAPKRAPIQFFNRRMYRGLGVSMSRSCVINAIFFSVFEVMKKGVNGLEMEEGEGS